MACGDQDCSTGAGCNCTHDLQAPYHPQRDPYVYLQEIAEQLDRLNTNIEKLMQKKDWSGRLYIPVELSVATDIKNYVKQLIRK